MRESCGSADVADVETPARCRLCGAILERTFVDLGMSPLCQTHTEASELERGETFYPLHVRVCARLGGWTGYYGKPGPVVMLRGLHYFRAIQHGWSLARFV